jgi:hypothetical protein
MADTISKQSRLRSWTVRFLILVGGIIFGQAILYGPSLTGSKILLSLDILAEPNHYIPRVPEVVWRDPHNIQLSDIVEHAEPNRLLLRERLRSGRFPLWDPYEYCGAPYITPIYSPFTILAALFDSPKILPWVEVLKAIVSGTGCYLFCRKALGAGFRAAVIAAWCYPLTAWFVLWQGYTTTGPVIWLPWLMLAVNSCIEQPGFPAICGTAAATAFILTAGSLDIAGQVLLASGFFLVWRLLEIGWRRKSWIACAKTAALPLLAWLLGFMLAAPQVLPILAYSGTGARMLRRGEGSEERPPVGIAALPQVVLPKMYGSTESGSFPIYPKPQGNLAESTAATYAGVIATLVLAPLAFAQRRHRSTAVFFVLLIFVGLSWSLNVPGMVKLLRLPGLNMMSHNRFVFVSSFSILCLAVLGIEMLETAEIRWRPWFVGPSLILAGLGVYCMWRLLSPPEPIASELSRVLLEGNHYGRVRDLAAVQQVQGWFNRAYAAQALWCGLGLGAWILLWTGKASRRWVVPVLAAILIVDLLWFGVGRAAQCEPALYFPPIPALEKVAKATPGRIIGVNCLPARLANMAGLRDVRGDDGVEPARLVDLMRIACEPESQAHEYALTQWLTPIASVTTNGQIQLSPVLDMLGTRYLIGRGQPLQLPRPLFESPDYWVVENLSALPRAFVPLSVETVNDNKLRLEMLSSQEFDPRKIAYIEGTNVLMTGCNGSVDVLDEKPEHIRLVARMQTPGLVVLGDLWDSGWKVKVDGRPAPMYRTNHAIRGVFVPSGTVNLEFDYLPSSFSLGCKLSALAVLILIVSGLIGRFRRFRIHRAQAASAAQDAAHPA